MKRSRIAAALLAILAGLVLGAAPSKAGTFASKTVKGTPGVLYEFSYTVATKDDTPVPFPGPSIVVRSSAPGQPSSLVCNTSTGTTLPSGARSFTLSFGLQFPPGRAKYKLQFSSTDNDLVLENGATQTVTAAVLPPIRLKVSAAGNYNVLLTLSTVYKGPALPDPLPTYTFSARGAGIGINDGSIKVTPEDNSEIQLSFNLTAKGPGQIVIMLRSSCRYLVLDSQASVYTSSAGKAVHMNSHDRF